MKPNNVDFKKLIFKKEKNFNQIRKLDNYSIDFLVKNMFGFNRQYQNLLVRRFEKNSKHVISSKMSAPSWQVTTKTFENIFPRKLKSTSKWMMNIYILDLIQTYRGWRHSKGLPVRGQRTWTNGWSSHRSNLMLRNFKVKIAQTVYRQVPVSEMNTMYLAEQINAMWKIQWQQEWSEAKSSRLEAIKSGKSVKTDLIGMAKGNIVSPQKFNKMSKKQKQTVKKDTFSLGFDPGFTKKLIDTLYRTQFLEQSKGKKKKRLSVIDPEDKKSKKIKKKKIDEKTKKLKHRLKKKGKKSVWD